MRKQPVNSTRRYKTGQVVQYDHYFNLFRNRHPVLSPEAQMSVGGDYYKDPANLRRWKIATEGDPALTGEDKGKFSQGKRKVWGSLAKAHNDLKKALDEFEKERQNAINQGKLPPKVPRRDTAEMIYKYEAAVDVERLAAARCNERLADLKEKAEDDSDVLPRGPQESAKLNMNNIVRLIDGQNVSQINGTLVIDDKRSPYDGMSVPDYRAMAKAWRRERTKKRDALRERQKQGENVHVPMGGGRVDKKDLPEWPEVVKNMKK